MCYIGTMDFMLTISKKACDESSNSGPSDKPPGLARISRDVLFADVKNTV